MGNHIKGFAIVKLCNIHCSSLVPRVSYLITKGNQVSEAWFLCGKIMLAIPYHCLVLHDPGNGFQENLLHTFPGIEVRLPSLQYPRSSLRLLNMGVMFAFFFPAIGSLPWLPRPFKGDQEWPDTLTSASPPSTLGCIPWGPMDWCVSSGLSMPLPWALPHSYRLCYTCILTSVFLQWKTENKNK